MKVDSDVDRIALAKTAADAASTQARIANRFWLSVIVVTIIVALPRVEPVAQLPFSLGEVPLDTFYPVAFLMLCILVFALAVAHARHMRADIIAFFIIEQLDSVSAGNATSISLSLKDMFDILRHPGFTHVAPIAQLVTGQYHSPIKGEESTERNTTTSFWTSALYLLVKIFALVVLFLIPMVGLVIAFDKAAESLGGWLLFVSAVIGSVALFSLLIVAVFDSKAVLRRAMKLSKKTVG